MTRWINVFFQSIRLENTSMLFTRLTYFVWSMKLEWVNGMGRYLVYCAAREPNDPPSSFPCLSVNVNDFQPWSQLFAHPNEYRQRKPSKKENTIMYIIMPDRSCAVQVSTVKILIPHLCGSRYCVSRVGTQTGIEYRAVLYGNNNARKEEKTAFCWTSRVYDGKEVERWP